MPRRQETMLVNSNRSSSDSIKPGTRHLRTEVRPAGKSKASRLSAFPLRFNALSLWKRRFLLSLWKRRFLLSLSCLLTSFGVYFHGRCFGFPPGCAPRMFRIRSLRVPFYLNRRAFFVDHNNSQQSCWWCITQTEVTSVKFAHTTLTLKQWEIQDPLAQHEKELSLLIRAFPLGNVANILGRTHGSQTWLRMLLSNERILRGPPDEGLPPRKIRR